MKSVKKRRRRKTSMDWTRGRFVRLIVEVLEDRTMPAVVLGSTPSRRPRPSWICLLLPANLSFENNLSGWSVDNDTTGKVAVVNDFDAKGGTDPNTNVSVPPIGLRPG